MIKATYYDIVREEYDSAFDDEYSMEDAGYKLEYEEQWGMCDDAAAYISWRWEKA